MIASLTPPFAAGSDRIELIGKLTRPCDRAITLTVKFESLPSTPTAASPISKKKKKPTTTNQDASVAQVRGLRLPLVFTLDNFKPTKLAEAYNRVQQLKQQQQQQGQRTVGLQSVTTSSGARLPYGGGRSPHTGAAPHIPEGCLGQFFQAVDLYIGELENQSNRHQVRIIITQR